MKFSLFVLLLNKFGWIKCIFLKKLFKKCPFSGSSSNWGCSRWRKGLVLYSHSREIISYKILLASILDWTWARSVTWPNLSCVHITNLKVFSPDQIFICQNIGPGHVHWCTHKLMKLYSYHCHLGYPVVSNFLCPVIHLSTRRGLLTKWHVEVATIVVQHVFQHKIVVLTTVFY